MFSPQYKFDKAEDISVDFLEEKNIGTLLLDLDNTLAKYKQDIPSEEIVNWINDLKRHKIELFLFSNSLKEHRILNYAKQLNIKYVTNANKPFSRHFKSIIALSPKEKNIAIIGDQIFTDILGGNIVGIETILIEPIEMNFIQKLRYLIESPFRHAKL